MLQVKGKKRKAAEYLDVNVPISETLPMESSDVAFYYSSCAAFSEASDTFEAYG